MGAVILRQTGQLGAAMKAAIGMVVMGAAILRQTELFLVHLVDDVLEVFVYDVSLELQGVG